MSPKNPPLIAGLAVSGLLWLATSVANGQAEPVPPGPPTLAPTSQTTYRALLLSSGKVVKGEIVADAATGSYRLRASGGPVNYPKTMVLKAADSLEELYRFQVARLPVGDTEERMKLAKWCLTEHQLAHAKEQLEAIQKMCPEDNDVKRMLYNLASMREDRPAVDPELRRTSGEMTRNEAPATLDPRFMVKVQRRFNALPTIFDLPQAQAVVRANEFANYVQPVLQKSCVKCHNEKYEGSFQLVEIKVKRDWMNPDIARANLDATLRLVNPDDPTRSELLSNGLLPHGGSKSAIFRGPNDPPYTILLTWVKSLRPSAPVAKGPAEAGSRTTFSAPEPMPGDGFATDRSGGSSRSGLPQLPGAEFANRAAASAVAPPSRAIVQNYEESAEFITSPGDKPVFPAPFSVGGMPPTQPVPPKAKAGAAASKGTTPGSTAPKVPAGVKSTTPKNPESVVVGPTDNPNLLPGMSQPLYPNSPKADPTDDDEEAKVNPADRKPKKIDNALLEKLMKSRNGAP